MCAPVAQHAGVPWNNIRCTEEEGSRWDAAQTAPRALAAQGLQHLVDLVDDMYSDGGALSDAGVCCIWRVLEAAAAAALNQRCRLLAAAGLPSRLVALCARARADLAAMQDAPRPRVSASALHSSGFVRLSRATGCHGRRRVHEAMNRWLPTLLEAYVGQQVL